MGQVWLRHFLTVTGCMSIKEHERCFALCMLSMYMSSLQKKKLGSATRYFLPQLNKQRTEKTIRKGTVESVDCSNGPSEVKKPHLRVQRAKVWKMRH